MGKGLQRLAQEVGGDSKVIGIPFCFLPGAFLPRCVQKIKLLMFSAFTVEKKIIKQNHSEHCATAICYKHFQGETHYRKHCKSQCVRFPISDKAGSQIVYVLVSL